MASPPFNIAETTPGDSDIVSQFPAAERTFRDVVEDWLLTEHGVSGHHTIPIKTTAQKEAITDWEAGSLVYDTTLNRLQLVETIDPDVFVAAHALAANDVTTTIITDDAVTFAKIQNITSDRLLGRDTASSGNVEEISLVAPLAWSGSGSIGVDAATTTAAGKVELAIASEMVTGTDTGRVPSVSVVKNHEGVAKAWGSISNLGVVNGGYGVTNVTHNSTGNYTVNLSVEMANDDYAAIVTLFAGGRDETIEVSAKTTTTFTVLTSEIDADGAGDPQNTAFMFVVFGTLA